MRCQFCNKNEADKMFFVNWMGIQYQISVCSECLEKMWSQAEAAGKEEAFKSYSGWWPGKPEPRKMGECPFPKQAEESLCRRRELAVLQIRLQEAAEEENYEEAARLRDNIATIEREVCSHEN